MCRCGHDSAYHEITGTPKRRRFCRTGIGPKGIPCDCREFKTAGPGEVVLTVTDLRGGAA